MTVELAAPPRCKGCGGACFWYRAAPTERLTFAADTNAIAVGATVTVTVPERFVLLGAVLVYGLPLAALLLGAAGVAALGGSDLAAAGGAALALIAALLAASRARRRLERALFRRLTVRAGA